MKSLKLLEADEGALKGILGEDGGRGGLCMDTIIKVHSVSITYLFPDPIASSLTVNLT